MPHPHPPERRQRRGPRRWREEPLAGIAENLRISESCLRDWIAQADVDEGRREGLSSRERDELVELRCKARTLKLENEILTRAAAYPPGGRPPGTFAFIARACACLGAAAAGVMKVAFASSSTPTKSHGRPAPSHRESEAAPRRTSA